MRRLVLLASFLLATVASCKQGEGEYCQINDDCKDGLVCAQITDTCEKSASSVVDAGTPDAEIPPDAEVPDATLPACSNGVDDDGDLLTDFPNDPECVDAADDDEAA